MNTLERNARGVLDIIDEQSDLSWNVIEEATGDRITATRALVMSAIPLLELTVKRRFTRSQRRDAQKAALVLLEKEVSEFGPKHSLPSELSKRGAGTTSFAIDLGDQEKNTHFAALMERQLESIVTSVAMSEDLDDTRKKKLKMQMRPSIVFTGMEILSTDPSEAATRMIVANETSGDRISEVMMRDWRKKGGKIEELVKIPEGISQEELLQTVMNEAYGRVAELQQLITRFHVFHELCHHTLDRG